MRWKVVHQPRKYYRRLQVRIQYFLACKAFLVYFLRSSITKEVIPSFILLAIQGPKVVTYIYELKGDQVTVSKSEFSK